MKRNAIALRYATSLYELARERNQVEPVLEALDRFRDIAGVTPQLPKALAGALLTNDEKKRLIADSLPGAPQVVLDFYDLVVDKHRAAHVTDMTVAFRALDERERNIIDATVRSAVALSDGESELLRQRLEAMTGATVRLVNETAPDILGGLIIQIGDKRIDLSLRARLEGLRRRVSGRRQDAR